MRKLSARIHFYTIVVSFFLLSVSTTVLSSPSAQSGFGDQPPRLGIIYEVQVQIENRGQLELLVRQGFDVGSRKGQTITIYAAGEELELLKELGYNYTIVEINDPVAIQTPDRAVYHTYAQMTIILQQFANDYPDICRLSSLGQSVQGRELWAIKITDDPDIEEDEPEFKYVAAMHGDESISMEMCLLFIEMLLTEYAVDTEITELVDETEIWIVPLMNPDGLELNSRYNAHGYDLNRSFPAYYYDYHLTYYDGELLNWAAAEPEVRHIAEWTLANSFVLSANFHSGALVANYPYDDDLIGSVYSPTPDDDLFVMICELYSSLNPPMWSSPWFYHGITNGADWYVVTGGMQDWNYRYAGCSEVTIELSDTKKPPASQIPALWDNNREAMLAYAKAVHMGIRGTVTDVVTGQPIWARIEVQGNSHPVFTDSNMGDYHRMLLPGTYTLTFRAPGYIPQTIADIEVVDGSTTRVDVELVFNADIVRDGIVDLNDLRVISAYWLQTDCGVCGHADLNRDADVDLIDLIKFCDYWLYEYDF